MISTTLKSTSTLQFKPYFYSHLIIMLKRIQNKTFVNYWKLNRHPGFPSNQEIGRTWRATSSFNQTICVSYFHEHRFLFSNFPIVMQCEISCPTFDKSRDKAPQFNFIGKTIFISLGVSWNVTRTPSIFALIRNTLYLCNRMT